MIYSSRKQIVYRGAEIVARAISKELAKKIARLLNQEKKCKPLDTPEYQANPK